MENNKDLNPKQIKNLLDGKTKEEKIKLLELIKLRKEKLKYNKIHSFFLDTGPFARHNYPKQMELMQAGKNHLIRAFIGGNGSGKTLWGSIETYFHASGLYPIWWEGRRFKKPINAWVVGLETKQMRASIQSMLFGSYRDPGTGIIPKDAMLDEDGALTTRAMAGTAECFGTCAIKHYDEDGNFDGWSNIEFKTCESGWEQFQGSNIQWIWMDEEPKDPKVYTECLFRTRGPKGQEGSMLMTWTPLKGYTTLYLSFMPRGLPPAKGINPNNPQKYTVVVPWEENGVNYAPHLTDEWKQSAIAEAKITDPHSIKARMTGLASLGTGRVYPIDEDFVLVAPFRIPDHWPRAYGMDFGWHATAVIWIAKDPVTGIMYVYDEYKRGEVIPAMHAMAIKSRGEWIPGLCDPSKGGRNSDGSLWIEEYYKLGLKLNPGQNAIAPGVGAILGALESGKLKFMYTCEKLINEVRMFRYSEKDPDVIARDQEDHLLDALKYDFMTFDYYAISQADQDNLEDRKYNKYQVSSRNTGRDSTTGY